jgi:hypothetical protein
MKINLKISYDANVFVEVKIELLIINSLISTTTTIKNI